MVKICKIRISAAKLIVTLVVTTIAWYFLYPLEKPVRLLDSAKPLLFRTHDYNCKYLLPFRLYDGSLSRICTYDPDLDYISSMIKRWEAWETSLVNDIMLTLGAAQQLLWNKTKVSLVDLGSNIGVFTLTAASAGYEVLAVDSMKESLQLLATTLHLAGLTSRVTILNNAISDVRGNVSMYFDKENVGGSYVKQSGQDGGEEASIWAIQMNDLIPYVRSPHVVIKMDIETFEEKALRSAADFFEKVDVYSVLLEWKSHRSDSGLPIIRFMAKRGLIPYTDSTKGQALETSSYRSWPDNVLFIR